MIINSRVKNETWLYGELGDLSVNVGQNVDTGDRIGRTAQYVSNNPTYPAMAHMEKYSRRNLNSVSGGGTYRRHSSNVNPSCHLEYMSQKKFRKIWERD